MWPRHTLRLSKHQHWIMELSRHLPMFTTRTIRHPGSLSLKWASHINPNAQRNTHTLMKHLTVQWSNQWLSCFSSPPSPPLKTPIESSLHTWTASWLTGPPAISPPSTPPCMPLLDKPAVRRCGASGALGAHHKVGYEILYDCCYIHLSFTVSWT